MKKAITHLSSVYSCQLETMKKAEKLGMGGQKDLYKPEGLCDLLELVNHLHLIRKLSVPSKSVNVLTSGLFVCLFVLWHSREHSSPERCFTNRNFLYQMSLQNAIYS